MNKPDSVLSYQERRDLIAQAVKNGGYDRLLTLTEQVVLAKLSDEGVESDFASTTMALIEDYAKAVHDGDDASCIVLHRTIKASLEQRVLAKMAEKAEPVAFLANATRFKVTLTQKDCYIKGLPSELGGRWVALVAAENDAHLKLTTPPASSALVEAVAKELLASVYDTAWRNSAGWSGVDHTLADVGSRQYKQERDEAIRAAIEAHKKGTV